MILSAAAGVVVDAPRKRLRAAAPLRAEATRGLAAKAVLDESAKRRICYESYTSAIRTCPRDQRVEGRATACKQAAKKRSAKAGELVIVSH